MSKNWKCRLGLHNWKLNRSVTIHDGSEGVFIKKPSGLGDLKRKCSRCGVEERWCPPLSKDIYGDWVQVKVKKL